MTILRVGGNAKVAGASAAGFTSTYTPTPGNLVLVTCTAGNGVTDPLPATVKDNNNNPLTIITSVQSTNHQRAFAAYYIAIAGATSFIGAGGNASQFTHSTTEWSLAQAVVDASILTATGANPLASGNLTNTGLNSLNILIGVSDDSGLGTFASNAGWTREWAEGDSTANNCGFFDYLIAAASTGPFSGTTNYSVATTTNASLIFSLLAAAGGASLQMGRMRMVMP